MYAGDETGNSVYSNAYTKLILSDEVLAASKAKISFNLGYVGNSDDTSLTITINGPGGTVVEITPELRGMALDAYVPEAQFSFGLVNLSTNEIYGANVSTDSGTYFLSDDIADWFTFNAGRGRRCDRQLRPRRRPALDSYRGGLGAPRAVAQDRQV